MRVLDRLADLDEEIESFLGAEVVLVAVVGDADAPDQFHHEVGLAGVGGSRIEHPGDVRMIHHRQRLPLSLEPGDDHFGVHAQLDDLERDAAADRLGLLGDIDHAVPAFTDLLQKFVRAERATHGFVRFIGEIAHVAGPVGDARVRNRGGLFVRGKQRFEALAQGGVAVAGGLEERGAFGNGPSQSLNE